MIEVKLNLPELPAGYEYTEEYEQCAPDPAKPLEIGIVLTIKQTKWRAEIGEQYYYVGGDLEVASQHDHRHSMDTKYWACDNYFESWEAAAEVAEDWKFVLKLAVEGGKDG